MECVDAGGKKKKKEQQIMYKTYDKFNKGLQNKMAINSSEYSLNEL